MNIIVISFYKIFYLSGLSSSFEIIMALFASGAGIDQANAGSTAVIKGNWLSNSSFFGVLHICTFFI